MAKIAEYLKQILSARYGRDVRQSIHDAISAINDESTECWATVEKVPETLAIAAVKDRVSGKDVTLPLSSDFVATDFKAKGNTEQDTTSGKNFAYFNNIARTHRGVTFTPVNDEKGLLEYVLVNGTNDGTGESVYTISSNLLSHLVLGTKYIMSGCPGGGSSSTYRLQHWGYSDSNAVHDYGNGVEYTFNDEDNNGNVSIIVSSGVTVSNLKFYPMVRLATITDGTYEPFTNGASPNPSYPQEIKSVVLSEIKSVWKNFFDYTKFTNRAIASNNGILFVSNSPKRLLSNAVNLKKVGENISVSWNTDFKLSAMIITNVAEVVTEISDFTLKYVENSSGNYTFTVEKEGYYTFYFAPTTDREVSAEEMNTAQLEYGTTATEYEPYTESIATLSEPITLNGLNGVSDYIDVKRGVEHHKFKTVVFDGSESGWKKSNVSGTHRYYIIVDDIFPSVECNFLCSQATRTTNTGNTISNTAFVTGAKQFALNTEFATLDEWKAHLASKPMEVTYELAEPIETPLPEADVEALKNIRTFKGTTHIFTDSEVKPDLEVEYVIDTKLYIDAKIAELQ